MLIKCRLFAFDAIFFYGQLVGKIERLKYRYCALKVQGLCGLITVTSQYEGYVITSL